MSSSVPLPVPKQSGNCHTWAGAGSGPRYTSSHFVLITLLRDKACSDHPLFAMVETGALWSHKQEIAALALGLDTVLQSPCSQHLPCHLPSSYSSPLFLCTP